MTPEDKIVLTRFNINDKVLVQRDLGDSTLSEGELGIIEKFGFNSMKQVIIGVRMIREYDDYSSNDLYWIHPLSTVFKITII